MERNMRRRRRRGVSEDIRSDRQIMLLRIPLSEIEDLTAEDMRRTDSVASLAASIARHGLLQPVVVLRKICGRGYRIVLGKRRLAACRLLGFKHIDAILTEMDEAEAAACILEDHEVHSELPAFFQLALLERIGLKAIDAAYALNRKKLQRLHALGCLSQHTKRIIRTAGLTLEQAEPLVMIHDERRQSEAASIIAGRNLTPAQARRLVCGPEQRQTCLDGLAEAGRRRAIRAAMEEITQLSRRLQMQGIDAAVSVHSQESGMCIQLRISKV